MKKLILVGLLLIVVLLYYIFSLNISFLKQKSFYKHQLYSGLNQVDERIKNWALKIEDKRFYHHFGVDFLALMRALKEDILAGSFKQGASTIDQQVVKLIEGNFRNRSIKTKFEEIFKAVKLNTKYSKDEIFLYWINNVYFPYNVKGFKSACKIYFGKSCNKLFDSEILFLFAMYQTGKNPFENFKLVKKRSYILCKYLDLDCKNFYYLPPVSKKDLQLNFSQLTFFDLLPENVKQRLKINPKLQEKAETIIENTKGFRNAIHMGNCCILAMDKIGNIITMATCKQPGKDKSWINPCLVKRQTGSAIKPFVYLKAMVDFGRTGGTILEDKPVDFVLNGLKKYIPRNFDMRYHGKVSLALALGSSLNVPAVTTLDKIGVENFLNFINQLRIKLGDDINQVKKDARVYNAEKLGLSAALGTYELSPLEFVNLRRIYLRLEELGEVGREKINEILEILAQNKNRVISFGLDNNLNVSGWAVKTGTSRHFVDGRTCGVNKEKQIVLCVWAGNLDETPMTKPGSESAGFLWNLVVSGF